VCVCVCVCVRERERERERERDWHSAQRAEDARPPGALVCARETIREP